MAVKVREKSCKIVAEKGKPVAVIASKQKFDKVIGPQTSLIDFFKAAPHQEVELELERSRDLPREFVIY